MGVRYRIREPCCAMDETTMAPPFWLARTKIQPPSTRHDTIARPQLLARLRAAMLDARLTLISAPAGYGKTTLLASFAASQPDLALAWLSLDEDDNDPARFLTALIAATQRLSPGSGREAAQLLAGLPTPAAEVRRVVAALINDLPPTVPDPCVLVLDDLHAIGEPAAFVALDYLLEWLPPQLHLIAATRHNPPLRLERLRARRQLAEVRLDDLRFTPEESAVFLSGRLELGLANEHFALIHGRTEGRVAGLGLVISALDGQMADDGRAALLEQLAQTDRYAFDFLANEVLARQDPEIREFLLTTALLVELTPARCALLTGRIDTGDILDALARGNLFVLPVESASRTYRYHDLFKDFLRQQLARDHATELPVLHRRAAQAEREAGLLNRAIDHYLAAAAWDDAVQLIDQVGLQVHEQRALEMLRGWIASVPETVQEAHPRLSYLLGVIAWDNRQPHEARPLLERALIGFQARGDRKGEGDALAYLIAVMAGIGAFPRAMALFDRALALPQQPHSRVELLMSRGFWELAAGHWAQCVRDIEESLAVVEAARDPRALRVLAVGFHFNLALLPGGLSAADRFQQMVATIGEEGQVLRSSAARLAATAALWRGDWATATVAAERALALSEEFDALILVEIPMRVLLAGSAAVAGDNATADQHCAGLLAALERPDFAVIRDWQGAFLQAIGRVRVLQGRLDEARSIAARLEAQAAPGDWPSTPGGRAILRGLIARAEGKLQAAEGSFREAGALLRPYPDANWFGDAELLVAATRLAQGHPNETLTLLAPILAECERAGTPGRLCWNGRATIEPLLHLATARGLHAEFAAGVLRQFDAPAPTRANRVPGTGEVLTEREIEVLRLVATGSENAEIADRLFLSANTAGNHAARLLAKLGVGSRIAAVARARELGML
jgi:LuxR family maltose regulon positive regulatory protein